jgi:hypothetical protein
MFLLLEEHRVIGRKKGEFEQRYRDGSEQFIGDDDFRLLWYFDVAHGTGPSYRVITGTAIRDGEAWERFLRRAESGDVHKWLVQLDELRYFVDGRILSPTKWTPLKDPFADAGPGVAPDHEKYLYWMTCGFPSCTLEDYSEEFIYKQWFAPENGIVYGGMARIDGFFLSSWGAGRWPEGVLIEKIESPEQLKMLIGEHETMQFTRRRKYLSSGLQYRDQWTTTLLRTSTWSPLGV